MTQNYSASRLYGALLKLAEKRNIAVIGVKFSCLTRSKITGLYYRRRGNDLILIEQEIQLEKKAFILAHELGHYALHRSILNTTCWAKAYYSDKKYRNKREAEADRFARKLIAFLTSIHSHGDVGGREGENHSV